MFIFFPVAIHSQPTQLFRDADKSSVDTKLALSLENFNPDNLFQGLPNNTLSVTYCNMSNVLIKAEWRGYIRESKDIPDRLLSVVEKPPLF